MKTFTVFGYTFGKQTELRAEVEALKAKQAIDQRNIELLQQAITREREWSEHVETLAENGKRSVPVPLPDPVPAELRQKILTTFRDDDPRWRVFMTIVAEHIAQAIEKAASPKAAKDHGTCAHTSGALMSLLDLRDELIRERNQAMRFEQTEEKQ
jgi:hypothetical protein